MANGYTEFCCRSGGSNLNSGTLLGDSTEPGTSATYTSTSGNFDGTSVFTPQDSTNPVSGGVAVGQFASVYADGATVPVYFARITAVTNVVNGAITLSTTAKAGTAPTSSTGNRTIKVGGAWLGPSSNVTTPFTMVTNALTNSTGLAPRINFKNDATYSITAALTTSNSGVTFQGYTTSYGDKGRAIVDGGTTGASYILVTFSGSGQFIGDIVFRNNGATSTSNGVTGAGAGSTFLRCVFHDFKGHGLLTSVTDTTVIECEAYLCNTSNTASTGGFSSGTATTTYRRCISHDNSGSNNIGFNASVKAIYDHCIAETNGKHGFLVSATTASFYNCDAYNNGTDGINAIAINSQTCNIYGCNFLKNAGNGITISNAQGIIRLVNCGFGSGTQANGAATSYGATATVIEEGTVTYASGVTPWVDPANGDFRINLAAAKGTGPGNFTQTQASYTGTVAYPDIGAGQHQDTSAASNGFVF